MSENKFELIIENGVVTGYKGESTVVEIPEGVTEIGKGAFQDCQFIEEVYSKSSVLKTIGDSAFENCKNLKVCNLKALKGSIEDNAFSGCEKLKSFVIPNGTIKIGSCAFDYCKELLYLIIPSSVFVIEGYILEIGNKKTVILGDIGSEAEEYAKSKMLPFKENTQATRNEFLQLENKKDNTGYKDFNIFGETVRCYKSVIVYQELLDFFKTLNADFSNEVMNSIPNDIMKYDKKAGNIVYSSQTYFEKVRMFLQKYGIFLSDTIFEAKTIGINANYITICRTFAESVSQIATAMSEGTTNLKKSLIAEAESKVTGLDYGIIGSQFDLLLHSIDEYRAKKWQRQDAYATANIKMQSGTNQIISQAQSVYASLLNETMLPAFDKSIAYVCDGLMQLVIDEMIEAKVVAKEVFNSYDITKSNKLIEQVNKNPNIDKKYAVATALKLYPLNIDAVILAIKEDCIDKALLDLIEFTEIFENEKLKDYFINSYEYIDLICFKERNSLLDNDNKVLLMVNELIDTKAEWLIHKINHGYDPAQLDKDSWENLVKNYELINSENMKLLNLTENDIQGENGQQILSQAIIEKMNNNAEENESVDNNILKDAFEKILKTRFSQTVCVTINSAVLATGNNKHIQCNTNVLKNISDISIAHDYMLGLKTDGTVIMVGKDDFVPSKFEWTNIIEISTTRWKAIGLKSDGTAVAVGPEFCGPHEVSNWNNLIHVYADTYFLGLKTDGTVVCTGSGDGYDGVKTWRNILKICPASHIVGLKDDGTVVAVGSNNYNQCGVGEWRNIIDISTGGSHTVGLKSNGRVVATGFNDDGRCNVNEWSNITAISAGYRHTVGLKSDGTVVAVGANDDGRCDVNDWTNIVAISAGEYHTVGIKSNGTVVATGKNDVGQCNVDGWKLFDDCYSLIEKYKSFARNPKVKIEEKSAMQEQQRKYKMNNLCQYCGGPFKGLFTKKCAKCGKLKDY